MAHKVRLTDAGIRKLRAPDPSGHAVIHRDTELRGFGVLCSGNSDRKTYVVQYGTRIPRRTIEDVQLMPIAEARDIAIEWLRSIKRGTDPKKTKPVIPTSNATVKQVLERYLAEKKTLRPTSASLYRLIFNKHLSPWFDRPLAEITPDDVIEQHKVIFKNVQKQDDDPRRDGRTMPDFCIRVFRALFNFGKAVDLPGLPETNPVNRLDAIGGWYLDGPRKRDTYITDADLPKFWACSPPQHRPRSIRPMGRSSRFCCSPGSAPVAQNSSSGSSTSTSTIG